MESKLCGSKANFVGEKQYQTNSDEMRRNQNDSRQMLTN